MVIRNFYTPDGIITRELTQEEIIAFAKLGDVECRREILKAKWATMTDAQKVKAIFKLLELEIWG